VLYFTEKEFQGWFSQMNGNLLVRLDILRHTAGLPIYLSKANGAIGRAAGPLDLSQHNVDVWKEVRAVDGYIPHDISYLEFFDLAKSAGFTGIGLYSGWSGGRGFHVDVRESEDGRIATWSAIYNPSNKGRKTVYYSIDMLLES
jgi:hypothetical protein